MLNPRLLPFLILLGLAFALEYLWFFYYFSGNALAIGDFLSQVGHAARSRWLYPLPFVVITMNLLIFARFTYISEELADPELVEHFGFIAAALVALVVSALLRLLLWLMGALF